MFIDVIIPTYNRVNLLSRAIESVLQQTYPHFNLYIVDDGSTDDTQEALVTYQDDPKVNIFRIENSGVSAARNFGVANSGSEWIAFLDSDDEWLPNKLAKQVEYLKLNPTLSFLHSEEIWIRNSVRVNPKVKHSKHPHELFQRSLEFCLISPSTVMMKRELFEKCGPFDESLLVCEDYDLWNKVLASEEVGFLDEYLVNKYGGHDDQLSTKYFAMDYWRVKSLANLLNKVTDSEQKNLIITQIKRKSEILIKGYQKHNNPEKMSELQTLLSLLD